jgi:hypothetical protein
MFEFEKPKHTPEWFMCKCYITWRASYISMMTWYLYNDISLKQHFKGRHVSSLRHIILIRTNQSFFILLKHACRVEKQQIPILQSLVWPNLGSNTRFYRTEDKQVNQYITDAVLTHMSWLHTLYKVVDPLIVSVCQLIAGMIPMWTSAFLFPLLVGISEWDRKFQTFQRTCSPCWFYLNLCCPSSSLDLGTLCLSSDVGTWCSSSDMDTPCSSVVSCVCLRSPVFVCEREYCSSSDMDTPVFVFGTCGSS